MSAAMFGPVTIKDDRGTVVALYKEPWLDQRSEKEAVHASRKAFSIIGGRKLGRADAGWLSVSIGTPVVAMVASTLANNVVGGHDVGWVVFLASVVGGVLVGNALNRRVVRKRVKPVMLKAGLCPSCGYGLNELRVEEDGCVVCAECGGAWRRG